MCVCVRIQTYDLSTVRPMPWRLTTTSRHYWQWYQCWPMPWPQRHAITDNGINAGQCLDDWPQCHAITDNGIDAGQCLDHWPQRHAITDNGINAGEFQTMLCATWSHNQGSKWSWPLVARRQQEMSEWLHGWMPSCRHWPRRSQTCTKNLYSLFNTHTHTHIYLLT